MLWPWRKRKEPEIVYIPVHRKDGRDFDELWRDESFLELVAGFRGNDTYISLVSYALRLMREAADNAKTPEELKGCNEGIKHIKELITWPVEARNRLNFAREQREKDKQDARNRL